MTTHNKYNPAAALINSKYGRTLLIKLTEFVDSLILPRFIDADIFAKKAFSIFLDN